VKEGVAKAVEDSLTPDPVLLEMIVTLAIREEINQNVGIENPVTHKVHPLPQYMQLERTELVQPAIVDRYDHLY